LEIDSRLRSVTVKPLLEAKIIKNPHLKKSVVKDRPDEKRWEKMKREEVRRLMNNSKGKGVKEYE